MEQGQQNDNSNFQPQSPEAVGFPVNEPNRKNKTQVPVLFIIIPIFVLVLGGLAFFVFRGAGQSPDIDQAVNQEPDVAGVNSISTPQAETATTTPIATASSTATAKPVDKSEIAIKILNGTGVPGEAAYLQTQLKSLGYSDITAGNASSQSSTQTEIVYLKSVSIATITELETKLKTIYTAVVSREGTPTGGANIEITTGPRKGSATSASSTPTAKASSTPTAKPSSSPTPTAKATQ